jgi:hypothetical protein
MMQQMYQMMQMYQVCLFLFVAFARSVAFSVCLTLFFAGVRVGDTLAVMGAITAVAVAVAEEAAAVVAAGGIGVGRTTTHTGVVDMGGATAAAVAAVAVTAASLHTAPQLDMAGMVDKVGTAARRGHMAHPRLVDMLRLGMGSLHTAATVGRTSGVARLPWPLGTILIDEEQPTPWPVDTHTQWSMRCRGRWALQPGKSCNLGRSSGSSALSCCGLRWQSSRGGGAPSDTGQAGLAVG